MIAQLSRFAGVGLLATLLHVVVALLASGLLAFSPQAANAVGFAGAVTFSYLGHGKITFGAELAHRFHAPRFFAASGLGLALSSAITYGITVWLGASFAAAMGVVAIAVPVSTFILLKFWVFASRHSSEP